jgi:uncharacterized protein (TIGR03083 family)
VRELPAELLYAELEACTARLAALVDAEDPALPIPACPGWTLRQLATHVGRAHRWATEIVATRSAEFIEFSSVPDAKLPADQAERGRWLTAGAAALIGALREAGDERVWAFGQLTPARFWARRIAHETLVHCADAPQAAGAAVEIPAAIAAAAVPQCLTVMSGPHAGQPDLRASALPAGSALQVHAMDPGLGAAGQWLVRNSGDGVQVLPEHGSADVELSGRAAVVLLVLMRRVPPGGGTVRVLGDAALLDRWLEQTAF